MAVETLVQYRYDNDSQLAHASFQLRRRRDVSHSNASGLSCNYRRETRDGQPRVMEHWTSDGENFHFRYDFKNRISWAVDVLSRGLEVHYNEDHRVFAGRDYGGERYAIEIEIDDNGNMTGLTLPDGNRLTFKYDEYARLVEETDPLGRTVSYSYHQLTTLVWWFQSRCKLWINKMLSEKIVNFCKTQGWWFDDASPEYEVELQKLGVDVSSDFAEFYLHAEDGPTFIQKGKEIYQVCWFSKNSNYDLALKRAHETLNLPKEYLPLDSFEGEGGFFYNKVSGEVVELSLGQDLTDFTQGKLKPQWSSFNKFLEMYFGLI